MITDNQKTVLKRIAGVFQKNKIPFQITGGLAAILYGARRPLYDIDIDVYKKDIAKVRELFFDYIETDLGHISDEKFDLYLLTLNLDGVFVDISQIEDAYVVDKDGNRKKMDTDISKAQRVNWEGLNLTVQNKQELIEYKRLLRRDTDLMDIEQIG